MPVFNNILAGSSGQSTGYDIEQSLRFNPADTPTMTRTPAGAGNRTTWTFSCWVKRCESTDSGSTGAHVLLSSAVASGVTAGNTDIRFTETNDLLFQNYYYHSPDEYNYLIRTNAKYRDPGAWYHVVAVWDTSNGTPDDRMRLYVNGEQVTSMQLRTNPSSSFESHMNSGTAFQIADYSSTANTELNGYLAELNFIDGQALTPASFGETNEDTNQWQAIEYDGSYGTNGYYLKFQDSSALGDDSSGNTNDFTPTNLAATDQVLDSPTRNYCTLNPLDKDTFSGYSLVEGNLEMKGSAASDTGRIRSTFNIDSGKWYWEVNLLDVASSALNVNTEVQDISYAVTRNAGDTGGYNRNWASSADNGIVMVAFNADIGALWYGYNNTWDGSATSSEIAAGTTTNANFSSMPTTATYAYRYVDQAGGSGASRATHNFGQDSSFAGNKTAQGNGDDGEDFFYTPPTGYKALNSSNLDDPAIALPGNNFNTILYTGTGANQSITGAGFQPDMVWIKTRNAIMDCQAADSVRGINRFLYTSSSDAEVDRTSQDDAVRSFDADGFSYGTNSGNFSGESEVSWLWKAGGTASSNGDGSITSSVSANTTAGFSIVAYTSPGTSADGTIGHGLSQAPELVITKNRDAITHWDSWVSGLSSTYSLLLNSDDPQLSNRWSATIPSASLVTVRDAYEVNGTDKYIAYCFHSVEGYSKVGSYKGNGSTDGSFIYTGMAPAFIMVKRTDSADNWAMYDSARDTYNVRAKYLLADDSQAEATFSTAVVDFLSNGFKWRGAVNFGNNSSGSYIYLAFAESPFKTSNAR